MKKVMAYMKKFFVMFCTAGVLLFVGLDSSAMAPRRMIMITGAACGVVNLVSHWLGEY